MLEVVGKAFKNLFLRQRTTKKDVMDVINVNVSIGEN